MKFQIYRGLHVENNTYHVISFMKGSNYFYMSRYKEYLKLIYKCLLNDMYTELAHMRISYREIAYVYVKAHVTVV